MIDLSLDGDDVVSFGFGFWFALLYGVDTGAAAAAAAAATTASATTASAVEATAATAVHDG